MRCGQQEQRCFMFHIRLNRFKRFVIMRCGFKKGIVKGAGNVDEIAKQYMDSLA